ncbi:MAG: DUF2779 domain-containing protein, partial [Deltaproteobacteria bacterium]|nr:DUF2779 domain-containing protein [Deltaproteobacteria bacterium]
GIIKITDKRVKAKHPIGKRMIQVEKNKKPYFNKLLVRETLKQWNLPYYFLDFETVAPPIPRHNNLRPYQAFPIQFSLHILKKPGVEPQHFEYLHQGKDDPRSAIAKALCKWIGLKGDILAFNASFERRFLKELADAVPKYASKLLAMSERMVDPQQLFREAVYYSGFLGSFSLKNVAPTLLGNQFDYSLLDISEGGGVEYFFNELVQDNISPRRKKELCCQILEYCRVDTIALVELVNWLVRNARKK